MQRLCAAACILACLHACLASADTIRGLEAWAVAAGAKLHAVKVSRDSSTGYNSLVLKANLAPGSPVMSIPYDICLSSADTSSDPTLAAALKEVIHPKLRLAMILLHHKHVLGVSASPVFPYIASLEGSVSKTIPALWTDSMLEKIRGTRVHRAATDQRRLLSGCYRDVIVPLTLSHPATFPPSSFTLEEWEWAAEVVSTRAFEHDGTLTLVPLLDMANHRPSHVGGGGGGGGPLITRDDKASTRFVSWPAGSGETLLEGQEFFNDYGRLNNEQLLLTYGFVPEAGTEEEGGGLSGNPDDSLTFTVAVTEGTAAGAKALLVQAGLLSEVPGDTSVTLQLFPGGISPGLLPVLRLVGVTEIDFARFKDILGAGRPFPDVRLEVHILNNLIQLCNDALKNMPPGDGAAAAAGDTAAGRYMAGTRRILNQNIEWLLQQMYDVAEAGPAPFSSGGLVKEKGAGGHHDAEL